MQSQRRCFFFQAEDGIRDVAVTGVQTCALPISIVADTNEELEQNMARYEPKHVDVTICVDDTLAKGVESWAWYGLQPINRLTVPNGTVLMTSIQSFGELLKAIHRKDAPDKLALSR